MTIVRHMEKKGGLVRIGSLLVVKRDLIPSVLLALGRENLKVSTLLL